MMEWWGRLCCEHKTPARLIHKWPWTPGPNQPPPHSQITRLKWAMSLPFGSAGGSGLNRAAFCHANTGGDIRSKMTPHEYQMASCFLAQHTSHFLEWIICRWCGSNVVEHRTNFSRCFEKKPFDASEVGQMETNSWVNKHLKHIHSAVIKSNKNSKCVNHDNQVLTS